VIFKASAPSNIALIKYMGKTSSSNNPTNGSLSYTLNYLKTNVELEPIDEFKNEPKDRWSKLLGGSNLSIELSEIGQAKFLDHLKRLRGVSDAPYFAVRSANEFPSDCGLASSASSFAALTMAFYDFAKSEWGVDKSILEMAQLSKLGSGSSCRSFFSPWALWKNNEVGSVELPIKDLLHFVVIVDQEKKSVSSSAAHKRVLDSDLFLGRPERANKRLDRLIVALKEQNWKNAFYITWIEFMDMHALFETAEPPFRYRTAGSFFILDLFEKQWNESQDGPLVTMDAGPNVHALYRLDQRDLAVYQMSLLEKNFQIVADPRLRNKN
jgi:diphosphomevalonate decarboxylase